jgi:uncharacterized membrane protein YtjA (UPF0391 family)
MDRHRHHSPLSYASRTSLLTGVLHSAAYCERSFKGGRENLFKEPLMLHYTVVFLVIALIAAVFGFGGIAAGAVGIAKILFFIFAILTLISFVMGRSRKG